MSTKEDFQDLVADYKKTPGYEPPIKWFQVWRYHRVFSSDYAESRCADLFLKERLKENRSHE